MEKIEQILRDYPEIKLEIGAGMKTGTNGWITLDQNDACDINWNLLTGIPFPDNSISIIYSSHLLEHFFFRDMQVLIRECWRVLKPGGIFSASVPCARFFIEPYMKGDTGFWDSLPLHWEPAYDKTGSLIDLVNYMAYMEGHHRYMFDEVNLVNIIKMNGFTNVSLRDFDPELDSLERKHESIFAIGYK